MFSQSPQDESNEDLPNQSYDVLESKDDGMAHLHTDVNNRRIQVGYCDNEPLHCDGVNIHRSTCVGACGIIPHILFPRLIGSRYVYADVCTSAIEYMNSGPSAQVNVVADMNHYYFEYFINPFLPFTYPEVTASCSNARASCRHLEFNQIRYVHI